LSRLIREANGIVGCKHFSIIGFPAAVRTWSAEKGLNSSSALTLPLTNSNPKPMTALQICWRSMVSAFRFQWSPRHSVTIHLKGWRPNTVSASTSATYGPLNARMNARLPLPPRHCLRRQIIGRQQCCRRATQLNLQGHEPVPSSVTDSIP
jgi:hypothetical protein